MKKLIFIAVVFLICFLVYKYYFYSVGYDELYSDRLVYLKSDSSLYSGICKEEFSDRAFALYHFDDGIPVGSWGQYYEADYPLVEGEYQNLDFLNEKTLNYIGKENLIIINQWCEGNYNEQAVHYLSIRIVEPKFFSKGDSSYYLNKAETIAQDIFSNYKRNYILLYVAYTDAVKFGSKRIGKDYKLVDGDLIEFKVKNKR